MGFLLICIGAQFAISGVRDLAPDEDFCQPSRADALTGTALTFGVSGDSFHCLGGRRLAVFVYTMVACLGVNDTVKVAMIKWRVVNAVTKKPVDVTPQIAKRAYELYEQGGAARTVEQFSTGARRSGRFGKMNPTNKHMRTTGRALPKE